MKCPNCGATFTCGCQKRATPDGKQGCTKCISTLKKESTTPKIK